MPVRSDRCFHMCIPSRSQKVVSSLAFNSVRGFFSADLHLYDAHHIRDASASHRPLGLCHSVLDAVAGCGYGCATDDGLVQTLCPRPSCAPCRKRSRSCRRAHVYHLHLYTAYASRDLRYLRIRLSTEQSSRSSYSASHLTALTRFERSRHGCDGHQ